MTPTVSLQTEQLEKPLVEHALEYARRGWAVFPCKPSTKAPYTEGGFKDASTDSEIVAQWWRRWPGAMIGVRMGSASGVWAIDPDAPKPPKNIDGRQSWAELKRKNGGAVHTHTHNTPSGGQHLLFKYRHDKQVTNREGGLAKLGINVRGEGGYIIAPPSISADGKVYEVAESLDYFNFADAPDWLYDLILTTPTISEQAVARIQPPSRIRSDTRHRKYAEAALRDESAKVAGTSIDRNIQLNNAAVSLGGFVAAGELTEGEVIGALYDAATACGYVASDGQRATMATINSGLGYGMQTPRVIPDRDYPLHEAARPEPIPGENVVELKHQGGFPFQLFGDLTAGMVAKRHLIKDVFARGETSAWIAPPGGLKSALMAQATVCVAGGLDWHGYKNKGAAGVVYFALERADLVRRRLQAHRERSNLGALPIAVVGSTVDLMAPATVSRILATMKEAEEAFGCSVGLAIFDTFAKLIAAGGGDEDKARDQGRVFSNIQRVKEAADIHVAIVGHTGKDESRGMRGSNAALGDADLMVTISGDNIRTAAVTKANDAPEGPLFSFKSEVHEFGHDEDGDPITVNVVSDEIVSNFQSERLNRARWPKGLKLVHEAITAALIDGGTEHQVGGNGPKVRAVQVQAARSIHAKRYVSSGDGDPKEAERKAWGRNFKAARSADLIGGETTAGLELIWLVGS